MPSAVICKSFSFDAAHQLPHHRGKCSHLHGHTYRVEVILSGVVQPIDGTTGEGMVVDFDVVTQVFKQYIDVACDHKFMVPSRNPNVHVAFEGGRIRIKLAESDYVLPESSVALLPIGNTTAECLAAWILDVMHVKISQVIAVRVYETPTSFAEANIS